MGITANPENKTKEKKDHASLKRLREMLGVLRSHDIMHGLNPQKLRRILEDMGPTYVKLGQIMSMRSDILPKAYCDELVKLRAQAKPMPFSEVRQVIEKEYGISAQNIFTSIDPAPLGSASIAQVHSAVLKNKQRVVIKVQRPGIRETMAKDITLMKKAVHLLGLVSKAADVIDFESVIDELWIAAQQEMDFILEASHNKEFARLNQDIAYVGCPKIEEKLTTPHIIVMEYIDGIQIDRLDELKKLGYDPEEIGRKLADNYCKQVLEDSFFHADPHPGNIWIREGKIIWLDLGMIGRLTNRDRELFRDALRSVSANDINELKRIVLTLGIVKGRINHSRLYTDLDDMVTKYGSLDLANMNLGIMVQELLEVASANNISMPSNLSMLARGIMTIEGVLSVCCPDTNFMQIISSHIVEKMYSDFDLKKELRHSSRALYSIFTKGLDIPSQISNVLKMTAKGQTKINLEITGSEEPLRRIDKMVNRIIICIITAALLIASSTICTTQMTPRILGIPLLGALGYFAALILGGYLLISIRKKNRP